MSAASLASFVIGKLTTQPQTRPSEAGDMPGDQDTSKPRLTTVWRTKSIPYDIPDQSQSFKSESSLLRLLRTRSMPQLLHQGSTPPALQPSLAQPRNSSPAKAEGQDSTPSVPVIHRSSTSQRGESFSPVRQAAHHSTIMQNSGHLSDASESTVPSLSTPPPTPRTPSPSGQRPRRTRSKSDGNLLQQQNEVRKNTEKKGVGLPSVKNLRGKFEDKDSPSKSDQQQAGACESDGEADVESPEAGMGPDRRYVTRHPSLLRREPRRPEPHQPPKSPVTPASITKRLQQIGDSSPDLQEATEVFLMTDQQELRDKSRSEASLRITGSPSHEPRRRTVTPSRMRPKIHRRSKSEPDASSLLLFHAQSSPPSVKKLKMLFEKESASDTSHELPPPSPRRIPVDLYTSQRLSRRTSQEPATEETEGAKMPHLVVSSTVVETTVIAKTPPEEKVGPILSDGIPSVRSLRSRFEAAASSQSFKSSEKETTSLRPSRVVVHTLRTPFERPDSRQSRSVSPDMERHGSLSGFSSASVKNLLKQFEALSPQDAIHSEAGRRPNDMPRQSPLKESSDKLQTSLTHVEKKDIVTTKSEVNSKSPMLPKSLASRSSSSSSSSDEEEKYDKRKEIELKKKEEEAKRLRIEHEQRKTIEEERRKVEEMLAKEEAEKKKALEIMEKRRKEEQENKNREERERKDKEERLNREREEKEQKEKEERERKEKEEKERMERERKVKEEKERKENEEKERERKENVEREMKERERKEKEEKVRKEREERKEKEDRRKEREEKLRKEREEQERMEIEKRAEKERKERKEREEKIQKEREERQRKEREEEENALREMEEKQRKDREEMEKMMREAEEEWKKLENEIRERKTKQDYEVRKNEEDERREREKEEAEQLKEREEKRRKEEKKREEEKWEEIERQRKRKEALIRKLSRDEFSSELEMAKSNEKTSKSDSSDSDSSDKSKGDKRKVVKTKVQAIVGRFTQQARHEDSPPRDTNSPPAVEHFKDITEADLDKDRVDAAGDDEIDERRGSDVATLVKKFRKMNERRHSSSSSSSESRSRSASPEKHKEEAPIPTIHTRGNVPGKVRTLRVDELHFFETGDGGAAEQFMRTQSLRFKKKEPFTTPRFGSLRGNKSRVAVLSTSNTTNAKLPQNCRRLNTDEMRFFQGEVTNIYRNRTGSERGGKTTHRGNKVRPTPNDSTLPDSEQFFRLAGQSGPTSEANGHSAPEEDDSDAEPSILRSGDEETNRDEDLYELDITLRSDNDTDDHSDGEHPMSLLIHSIQGELLQSLHTPGATEDTRCYVVFSPGSSISGGDGSDNLSSNSDDDNQHPVEKFPLAPLQLKNNIPTQPLEEISSSLVAPLEEVTLPAVTSMVELKGAVAAENTSQHNTTQQQQLAAANNTEEILKSISKSTSQSMEVRNIENVSGIDHGDAEGETHQELKFNDLVVKTTYSDDNMTFIPLLSYSKGNTTTEDSSSDADDSKEVKNRKKMVMKEQKTANINTWVTEHKKEYENEANVKTAKTMASKEVKEVQVFLEKERKEGVNEVTVVVEKEVNEKGIRLVNETNILKQQKRNEAEEITEMDEKQKQEEEKKKEEEGKKKKEEIKNKKEEEMKKKKEEEDKKKLEQEIKKKEKEETKKKEEEREKKKRENQMKVEVEPRVVVLKGDNSVLETIQQQHQQQQEQQLRKQDRPRIDPDEKVDQKALAEFLDEIEKLNTPPKNIHLSPSKDDTPNTRMDNDDSSNTSENSNSSEDENEKGLMLKEELIKIEEQIIPMSSSPGVSASNMNLSENSKGQSDVKSILKDSQTSDEPKESKELKDNRENKKQWIMERERIDPDEKVDQIALEKFLDELEKLNTPQKDIHLSAPKDDTPNTRMDNDDSSNTSGSSSSSEDDNEKVLKLKDEEVRKIEDQIIPMQRNESKEIQENKKKTRGRVTERERIDPDEKLDQRALEEFLDELERLNTPPKTIHPSAFKDDTPNTRMDNDDSSNTSGSSSSSEDDDGKGLKLKDKELRKIEDQIIPMQRNESKESKNKKKRGRVMEREKIDPDEKVDQAALEEFLDELERLNTPPNSIHRSTPKKDTPNTRMDADDVKHHSSSSNSSISSEDQVESMLIAEEITGVEELIPTTSFHGLSASPESPSYNSKDFGNTRTLLKDPKPSEVARNDPVNIMQKIVKIERNEENRQATSSTLLGSSPKQKKEEKKTVGRTRQLSEDIPPPHPPPPPPPPPTTTKTTTTTTTTSTTDVLEREEEEGRETGGREETGDEEESKKTPLLSPPLPQQSHVPPQPPPPPPLYSQPQQLDFEASKDIMSMVEFIKFCIFSIWFSLLMYATKDIFS